MFFRLPAPRGIVKALAKNELAEKFKLPIITFIDTQVHIRESARRNVVRRRRSREICAKWRD